MSDEIGSLGSSSFVGWHSRAVPVLFSARFDQRHRPELSPLAPIDLPRSTLVSRLHMVGKSMGERERERG